ncbi:hypothetical protein N9D23_05060 [Rubripirellula sp.]|nr:hypothetical protein [Rubripirellula sp.]
MRSFIQTTLLLCLIGVPVSVTAQQADGGAAGLSRRPAGSRPSSPGLDRASSQVQQRLQSARTNSQLRSQAQDRRRQNSQQRAQAEARRAAEIALTSRKPMADGLEQIPQVERSRERTGLRRGASETAHELAGRDGLESRRGTGARIGIQAGVSVPSGLTKEDVRIFDDLFGRFNPLLPQRPATDSMLEDASLRVLEAPRSAGKAAGERRQRAPEDIEKLIDSKLSFADRIRVAARQRRTEISQMRDDAIAKGRPELLIEADQIETRLNAFSEAQIRLQADRGAERRTAAADSPSVQ